MYRTVITARIKNGRIPDAMPAAKAIATYLNDTYPARLSSVCANLVRSG